MQVRILLADDNPAVRTAMRRVLEGINLGEITEARDGEDAVLLASQLRPTLVILDLAMPVKDGLSAAREISEMLPETTIFMYTMHWTPLLETEVKKVGVKKLFAKSQTGALFSAVQDFLSRIPAVELNQNENVESRPGSLPEASSSEPA